MSRVGPRGIGKSNLIDVHRIADVGLPLTEEQRRTSRIDDGIRAATQILLTARDELTRERTRAVNALTSLMCIADLALDARRPLGARRIAEFSRWRPREEGGSPPRPPAPRPCRWPTGFSPWTRRSRTTRIG